MPNKYNSPESGENPNDRPLTSTEQSNRDADIQYQRERSSENNAATNGLLIGSIFTALLGLGGVTAYYYSNNQPSAVPTTIINNPPSPTASAIPEKQTKVIERTIEKAAPPQVIQIDKPVAVPPQIIEVPKPVLVPGETKVIEVPKPFATPMLPGAAQKADSSKSSATPSATASNSPTVPSSKATKSPEAVNPSLPSGSNSSSN